MKKIVLISILILSFLFIMSCSEDDKTLEYRIDGQTVLTDFSYAVLELTRNVPVVSAANDLSTKNPFDPKLTAYGSVEGSADLKGTVSGTTSPTNYAFSVTFDNYSRTDGYKYNGTGSLTGIMSFTSVPPKINFETFTFIGSIKLEGDYQDELYLDVTWSNNVLVGKLNTPSTNYWGTFNISLPFKK